MKERTKEDWREIAEYWEAEAARLKKALHSMKEAAEAQHYEFEQLANLMEQTALAGLAYTELHESIMNGDTGIGGAL